MNKYGIIAIHGGNIEPGTSEIAKEIAGKDFPLYINEKKPHITSVDFRNNEIKKIFNSCETIISIHGVHGLNKEFVMVGGLDSRLIKKISKNLNKNGFKTKIPPEGLNGNDKMNVCNLGISGKGIQLEISRGLRNSLLKDINLLKIFVKSIKELL